MFLVFNKEKIYSYIVAVFTVVVLFLVASTLSASDTVETAAKSNKKLPIYSVKTEEKKLLLLWIVHGNNYFCDRI